MGLWSWICPQLAGWLGMRTPPLVVMECGWLLPCCFGGIVKTFMNGTLEWDTSARQYPCGDDTQDIWEVLGSRNYRDYQVQWLLLMAISTLEKERKGRGWFITNKKLSLKVKESNWQHVKRLQLLELEGKKRWGTDPGLHHKNSRALEETEFLNSESRSCQGQGHDWGEGSWCTPKSSISRSLWTLWVHRSCALFAVERWYKGLSPGRQCKTFSRPTPTTPAYPQAYHDISVGVWGNTGGQVTNGVLTQVPHNRSTKSADLLLIHFPEFKWTYLVVGRTSPWHVEWKLL